MRIFQFIFVLMLFIVTTAYADLIKYTDKDGTLCFVDDLGKVPARYRQNIIRDEEENAAQIMNSEDLSRQTNSAGNSNNEIVEICYGVGGLDKLDNAGHVLTCFLQARGYPYRLYNVSRYNTNTSDNLTCTEYWCKLQLKNDSPSCIKETSGKINLIAPFAVIGNSLFRDTKSGILKEIDTHFNVDPKTRVKWQHGSSAGYDNHFDLYN